LNDDENRAQTRRDASPAERRHEEHVITRKMERSMTPCRNHPNESAPPDPMMRRVAAAGGFAWLAALPALWNWDALGWVEAILLLGALGVA